MNARLVARYALREGMGLVIMGLALFWAAGTLAWWPAWAVLILTAAWSLAAAIVILRLHPDLLAERLGPRKGAKPWDTAILGLLGLLQLARCTIAGLDQRYNWTGDFPLFAQILGLIVGTLGYALFVWAMAANAFFSQVVRIQTEREHTVARGGPYRFLRHPAYAGAIVHELGIAALLGSWWAFIPGGLAVVLLVLRTALEDRTLLDELDGYANYAREVRHRLLPGVW